MAIMSKPLVLRCIQRWDIAKTSFKRAPSADRPPREVQKIQRAATQSNKK